MSYVTSAANPRYRQSRDCQLRLKTIRLKEEKESGAESLQPVKKKKKSKGFESQVLEKVGFVDREVVVVTLLSHLSLYGDSV